jgi:uncharacterized protein (TIGR03067 family)
MVDLPAPDANDEANWRDLRPVLDDELQHLPERYRRPVVLFYLEGKSAEEVATALGRPRGTVLSQLARARELLRVRLSRRNVACSVGVLAGLLEGAALADAAVPHRLLDLGMQTLSAGGAGVSAQAGLLAREVLKDMLRRQLWTIGSLVAAALLAGFLIYGALRASPVGGVQAEARSDLERLQGDWQVDAVEEGGRVLRPEEFPFTSLKIRDDTILHQGGRHEMKVRFRLQPEQQPAAIDMEIVEGYHHDTFNAIYALDGDTLRICRAYEGVRPTRFESKSVSTTLLYSAKRIRPAGP